MKKYYVTEQQLNVIRWLVAGKSFKEIATLLDRKIEIGQAIAVALMKKGYLKRNEQRYYANLNEFQIGTWYQIKKDMQEQLYQPEIKDEIEVFTPTEEIRRKAYQLHSEGLKRSEIARRLGLKKSEILWTMMNLQITPSNDPVQAIPCDNIQDQIFRMLKKPDVGTMYMAKRLGISIHEVANVIHELEQIGAITVVRKPNYIAYLQNDVNLNPCRRRYEGENEGKKVRSKR